MTEETYFPHKIVGRKESREEIASHLSEEIIDSQKRIHGLEEIMKMLELYDIGKDASLKISGSRISEHAIRIKPEMATYFTKESEYKAIGREIIETWREIYGGRHEWESEETARQRTDYAIRKEYQGGKSIICADVKPQAEILAKRIEKLLKDIQAEEPDVMPCYLEVKIRHVEKHPEILEIITGLKDIWTKQEDYLLQLYKQLI